MKVTNEYECDGWPQTNCHHHPEKLQTSLGLIESDYCVLIVLSMVLQIIVSDVVQSSTAQSQEAIMKFVVSVCSKKCRERHNIK